MTNPTAYFDTLLLGDKLSTFASGFSRSELQLMCYAACLLSLYDGHPSSDWDYTFISAPSGRPLANDVDEAITTAIGLGMIEAGKDLFTITARGKDELKVLAALNLNHLRQKYLNGAADTLLVLTPGNIREAFDFDINIAYLKKQNKTDWLLDESDTNRLFANFTELKKALTYKPKDLSVPLVSWLKYLIQTGRVDQNVPAIN